MNKFFKNSKNENISLRFFFFFCKLKHKKFFCNYNEKKNTNLRTLRNT